jgi:hypothetical protein
MEKCLEQLDAGCVFLFTWIGSEHKMMLCQAKRRVVCKTESCTVSGFTVDARSLAFIPQFKHDVLIMHQGDIRIRCFWLSEILCKLMMHKCERS